LLVERKTSTQLATPWICQIIYITNHLGDENHISKHDAMWNETHED
jgi:hypothetical protein